MKKIELNSRYTEVDEDDYEWIKSLDGLIITKDGYAQINCGIHRLIYTKYFGKIPKGMVIDHIDGNPHNNCKNNLRLASVKENQWNKKSIGKTGYKGVYLVHKSTDRYKVCVSINGKRNHKDSNGGYFDNLRDAAIAADILYKKLSNNSDFVKLNIPDVSNEDYDRVFCLMNRTKLRSGNSRFVGVHQIKGTKNLWQVQITNNGEKLLSKYIRTELDAAKAYDYFIRIHNLSKKLNFGLDVPLSELKKSFDLILITKTPNHVYFDSKRQAWFIRKKINKKQFRFGAFENKTDANMALDIFYHKMNFLNDITHIPHNEYIRIYRLMYGHGNSKKKNCISKYRGVSKHSGKFVASIQYKGESIYLGRFENEKDAAISVNKKGIELFGEDFNVNIL